MWFANGFANGQLVDAAVPFVLTVAGYVLLASGGWLGGAITFVHGMRVLGEQETPWLRAIAPAPHDEDDAGGGG